MNFSEFLDVKINAMIYDRCMFNAQGKHRPEIAKYHLALMSNTSSERYDIYILQSNLLSYDEIQIPEINGAPAFEFDEESYAKIDREFYFFEVHSAGVIFTPNFAFEKYEECGRYIMNYTKDTRMLDVMFKKLTQEEAGKLPPQAASPVREKPEQQEESEAEAEETANIEEEPIETTADEPVIISMDEPAEESEQTAPIEEEEEEKITDIPVLAYDMFCLDLSDTTKSRLTEFSYPFISPVSNQKYEVSAIRSNHKKFEDIKVPEKNGKPMIEINRASYNKLTEKDFYFIEAVADGRTQVPNIKFDSLEAAKKYMYNFTSDTRPLDILFKKLTPEDAEKMDKQPSVKPKAEKAGRVGAVVPAVNMSIYTRFCSRTTAENKDVYTMYRCMLRPENSDRKYSLRVLKSNSKSYDAIVVPVANGKKLFELDRTDYEKMTAEDFYYIEATFKDKTGALNKIFKTHEKAQEYIALYNNDIRELEVLFKNIVPETATKLGPVKGVELFEDEESIIEEEQVETEQEEKVDFIEVENGERDSAKVQVAKETEDELFEGEKEEEIQAEQDEAVSRRRVTLMTESNPGETEEAATRSKTYANKITTDDATTIYADKVIIHVGNDISFEGGGGYHFGYKADSFDDILRTDDPDTEKASADFESSLEEILHSIGGDETEDLFGKSGLSREDRDILDELMDGMDDDLYETDSLYATDDFLSDIWQSDRDQDDLSDLFH